ncbi:hypothetical protein NTGM5_550006 [Candidatus Nitrotoga sp. M5]|nr:hypothetical protein NTGM5_550006 [Candidatus Nitrotoga sp. M5]
MTVAQNGRSLTRHEFSAQLLVVLSFTVQHELALYRRIAVAGSMISMQYGCK